MPPSFEIVQGDLLQQSTETIVNAWNTNRIPWWLLQPHGVSGAIKHNAGIEPFRQLQSFGPLQLGQAVITNAGKLNFKAIIHVASITLWGTSSSAIVRSALSNALDLAQHHLFSSVALPLLGTGSGGLDEQVALTLLTQELAHSSFSGHVVIVCYQPSSSL